VRQSSGALDFFQAGFEYHANVMKMFEPVSGKMGNQRVWISFIRKFIFLPFLSRFVEKFLFQQATKKCQSALMKNFPAHRTFEMPL
jgi:hypothetical protein